MRKDGFGGLGHLRGICGGGRCVVAACLSVLLVHALLVSY